MLARACIPYTKQAERRTRIQRFLSALPVVLPMLLALATAMAQYVVLTNWFLLDVAAFFTGFTAVYLLAGAVLIAFGLGNTRMRRTMPYIWPSPATVSRFTTRASPDLPSGRACGRRPRPVGFA